MNLTAFASLLPVPSTDPDASSTHHDFLSQLSPLALAQQFCPHSELLTTYVLLLTQFFCFLASAMNLE